MYGMMHQWKLKKVKHELVKEEEEEEEEEEEQEVNELWELLTEAQMD